MYHLEFRQWARRQLTKLARKHPGIVKDIIEKIRWLAEHVEEIELITSNNMAVDKWVFRHFSFIPSSLPVAASSLETLPLHAQPLRRLRHIPHHTPARPPHPPFILRHCLRE